MFEDLGQAFLWLLFAATMVVYSFVVLQISFGGSRSRIWAARNMKPRSEILLIHGIFLGVIFNILLLTTRLYYALSESAHSWLVHSFVSYRPRLTPLDCAFIAVVTVVGFIERRFIYVDAVTGKKDLPDDLDFY
jgi:nitric oxide reductase large subunit